MDGQIIIAIVGTALAQISALALASWSLGSRIARMEARMEATVTARECSELRDSCPARGEHTTGVRPRPALRLPGGA